MKKKGIPYNTKRRVNILDLPLIRNLRTFLEYLQSEFQYPHSGEYLLFRLLYVDFWGLSQSDITKLSAYLAMFEVAERPRLRDVLRKQSILSELNLERPDAIRRLSDLIDNLLSELNGTSLIGMLEKIINRCGLLKMVTEHPDKVWLLQVIKTFFDFVKEETDRHPRLTLNQLLETLQSMDANRLPIGINKATTAAHGVNLITAHSAKGLEFQRVFLIDCVKDNWESSARNSSYRFLLPDTLTFSSEEDPMEARRRLFYVAMTRAKELLHISYSEQDNAGKELQRAVFVDEIANGANLQVENRIVSEASIIDSQLLQLSELPVLTIHAPDKALIDKLLEGFSLNISALNQYLKCPLGFYFENILKVPVLPRESASYGTAMHSALRRLFEKMLLSKSKAFPDEATLVRLFEEEMQQLQGKFSKREFARRLELGRRNLAAYYQNHLDKWTKNVRVEFTIRNAQINGVPVAGTIDRLDFQAQLTATVVDYKIGKADASRLRDADKAPPYGGSYWRQLVFYKLLYESIERSSRRITSGVITWLDPDIKGQFIDKSIDFSSRDTLFLRQLIQETYTKIMNHEFYEGCGKSDCQWCNFVRSNVTVDSFSEVEVEELDD